MIHSTCSTRGDVWNVGDAPTTVGLVVGFVGIALTGVGVFVDIGFTLGMVAVRAGAVGSALDAVVCWHGDGIGCAGTLRNGVASGYAGFGLVAESADLLEDFSEGATMGFGRILMGPAIAGYGLDVGGTAGTYEEDGERSCHGK